MLSSRQKLVAQGMLKALAVMVPTFAWGVWAPPPFLLPPGPFPLTLANSLRWDLPLLLCLLSFIGILGRHRFLTPEEMDGSGLTQASGTTRILQAVLQNTLEQVILAVGAHSLWAVMMPVHLQGVVPVASILFVLGRILFWQGYKHGAPGRAMGFALTFYPTVAMYLVLVGQALGGLVS